jgi:pantothenate kinase
LTSTPSVVLRIHTKCSNYQLLSTAGPHRILVGIAGIPASGKTTFAHLLTGRINLVLNGRFLAGDTHQSSAEAERNNDDTAQLAPDLHANSPHDQAILVGLDGWHLSRAQLDVFPEPQVAHDRRGSHWTFDGAGYVSFVRQLRDTSFITNGKIITAPSFDHALKDPTPNAVSIHPYHRIVIIEGLYVFLAVHPWSDGGLLLDERWFIQVDPKEARRTLVGRHVSTGVAKDMEEAKWRADENDMPSKCP